MPDPTPQDSAPGSTAHAVLRPLGRFEWERLIRECMLATTTKSVGLMLATYVNRNGHKAHPGETRLASDLGLTDRSVRNHLKKLRSLGLVERTHHGRGPAYRRLADVYRLTVPEDLEKRVQLREKPGA